MKIIKFALLFLIALVILLIGGNYLRNKLIGPEGWAMDDTEKHLRTQMKDPESMVIRSSQTFTRIDEADGTKNIYICGQVSGKNSFGAYAGSSRFVSWSTSGRGTFELVSVTIEEPEDVDAARKVNQPSSFEKVYWTPHCGSQA